MSFISDNLRGVSWRSFYEAQGWRFSGSREKQVIKCPMHGEGVPSLSVDLATSLYNCFACGRKGDGIGYLKSEHGMTDRDAIVAVKKFFGLPDDRAAPAAAPHNDNPAPRPSSDPRVERWHNALLDNPDRIRWLLAKRGLDSETIRTRRIGWVDENEDSPHRGRYSFPIFAEDGSLAALRVYKPDHQNDPRKMIPTNAGMKAAIYPIDVVRAANPIILCEGELDALLANQLGIPAVTGTAGAKTWKEDWTALFAGKSVVIVYDNDQAGEEGAERVGEALFEVAREVRIVKLPVDKKGGDLTDYFMEYRGDPAAFWELVQETAPIARDAAPDDPSPASHVTPIADLGPLRATINAVLADKSNQVTKARQVADLIYDHLAAGGRFYIDRQAAQAQGAQEDLVFYFNERTKELFTIVSPEFDALVYSDTWVNREDAMFRKVRADLHARAINNKASRVDIYSYCHYDDNLKAAYIYSGANRVYVLNGDDQIREEDNGVDGVLFQRGQRENVWTADFNYEGEPILDMFKDMRLEESELTEEQQRLLLAVYTVGIAFPELQPTRMIPVFIGQQGSGKSFTARRLGQLWAGPRWQVSTVEGEKEDDFARLLTQELVVAADNLDNRIHWIHDMLARTATGAEVQRRKLYSDGVIWRAQITAFLMITTREPRWIKREDVTQRCLPIRVAKRADHFLAEHVLQKLEREKRPQRMGHLLHIANNVVKQLRDGAKPAETSLRIADFAFLGGLIANAMGKGPEFDAAVKRLTVEQRRFLAEEHPLFEALEEWLARGNRGRSVDLTTFYRELADAGSWSDRRGIRHQKGLVEKMVDMKDDIERRFGPFNSERDSQSRRVHYKFLSDGEVQEAIAVEPEAGDLPF